ncbi:glutamine amidotransferase [Variovorax soli]|uniref:GMP synthase (Glutamine-hydrolyzing) n=1 Tax=Variovorax soli TaxID=376815 RepID=A0ABU1NMC6_9BURK|nr:glutamine amidotransferase [Variovorax soli]MDR6539512.1 GMP synthase (glutamine-hydrolyzing) [Variovorax soli]
MDDATPRPLAIIKAGDTFGPLREQRGDFEHWVLAGLGPIGLPVVVLDPRRGDTLPAPQQISGAIVTGSHAMVSHREPWSEATGAWLAQLVAHGTPLLGICFGHQLLAHALGGEAGGHPGGPEIGTVGIALAAEAAGDALLGEMPARFDAHVVHWQSAVRLPPGAVRLAGNAFEPHQAFRVGPRAWGLQFHPEFDAEVMRYYIDRTADELRERGADPDALRARVADAEASTGLLRRFACIAEAHQATAAAPA